jgi:tetratricopeptide (TPR) repeat protein
MTFQRHAASASLLVLLFFLSGRAHAAKPETWLRASTAEVTVITPLSAKEAAAWAGEFAQYTAALRAFFGHTRVRLPPLTVVVFPRERDFERYYPLLGPGGKPQRVDGYFSRHESWAVAGLTAGVSEETRRTIFHEGVHWFLSGTKERNPVWLEEGLAEVFSTFRADKAKAEWGRAIPEHVDVLRLTHMLPLEKLLFTAQSELFGKDEIHTGIVYAESWAFVHFLIFGKHEIPRKAIGDYSEALATGGHPDEAFRRIFGHTYAEMDRLLEKYVHGGSYFVASTSLAAVEPPTVEPATKVDVENALGRLAIAGDRYDQATTHGRAAIAAAETDPRGHELLGFALDASGSRDGALAEYAAAIDRGSKDFRPYFEAAVAAHNAAVAGDKGEFTPTEARAIANRYERAINFYPRFRTSYENLAGVVGLADPWGEEDRKFLELGLRLFPDSASIELGLAQLSHRAGDLKAARARLDKVLATRGNLALETAQYANRLDISWEQEEIGKRVDGLAKEQKFTEAMAYLDERLAQGVNPAVRPRLAAMRATLEQNRLQKEIKNALEERRWSDARRALEQLLATSAPPPTKAQARRTLADLDRQKLGVDPDKP